MSVEVVCSCNRDAQLLLHGYTEWQILILLLMHIQLLDRETPYRFPNCITCKQKSRYMWCRSKWLTEIVCSYWRTTQLPHLLLKSQIPLDSRCLYCCLQQWSSQKARLKESKTEFCSSSLCHLQNAISHHTCITDFVYLMLWLRVS